MNARTTKSGIVISGILNESLKERVDYAAEYGDCKVAYTDFGTKAKITGTTKQLNKFIESWNHLNDHDFRLSRP